MRSQRQIGVGFFGLVLGIFGTLAAATVALAQRVPPPGGVLQCRALDAPARTFSGQILLGADATAWLDGELLLKRAGGPTDRQSLRVLAQYVREPLEPGFLAVTNGELITVQWSGNDGAKHSVRVVLGLKQNNAFFLINQEGFRAQCE